MRISVFGLGYVGAVTAACFATDGHQVIGIDTDESKVDLINKGKSPIVEEGVGDLICEGARSGDLFAATSAKQAVDNSDLAFICVGTPSQPDGGLDTDSVGLVAGRIGRQLRGRARPFLLVLRSTILPGTTRSLVIPSLETHSRRAIGDGYDVVYHPEFLREGTSVHDFYNPPKIVVGERIPGVGRSVFQLYDGMDSPRFSTSIEVAEAVKYADNAFHALKIAFTNEIGRFCGTQGIDSRKVMNLLCADTKLNISAKYLRPGYAFGGSCLGKDLRALLCAARSEGIGLPLLESILPSNQVQVTMVLDLIERYAPDSVGMVGLSFKPGTDDLRESPLVELAERLIDNVNRLRIYDKQVRTAQLVGSNKAYMEQHVPYLSGLLVESLESLSDCDLIIVGHPVEDSWLRDWLEAGKLVVDLVGNVDCSGYERYMGIAW